MRLRRARVAGGRTSSDLPNPLSAGGGWGDASRRFRLAHKLLSVTTPPSRRGSGPETPYVETTPLRRAAPSEQTVHPTLQSDRPASAAGTTHQHDDGPRTDYGTACFNSAPSGRHPVSR